MRRALPRRRLEVTRLTQASDSESAPVAPGPGGPGVQVLHSLRSVALLRLRRLPGLGRGHLQDAQVILGNIETSIPKYAIEY